MPLSTVSVVTQARAWAGSAGSGSSSRSATSAPVPASSSTSTSRSSAVSPVASATASAAAAPAPTRAASTQRQPARHDRLGVRPRRRRRLQPPRLRRGARRRTAATAIGFLRRAIAFFARYGIPVERILTDNGSAYRSAIHALACRAARDPPPPHAGPTARRQTAKPNASSARCSKAGPTARSTAQATNAPHALDGWLWHYNHRRRALSEIGHRPPVSRTNLSGLPSRQRLAVTGLAPWPPSLNSPP